MWVKEEAGVRGERIASVSASGAGVADLRQRLPVRLPAAPGGEGKAGWGPPRHRPFCQWRAAVPESFPWDRGEGGEGGIPVTKRNEEANGCAFKLVFPSSFSPRMRGSVFGLARCGGSRGQDGGWKKLLILHAVVCAGSGSKSAKLGL